MSFQKLYLRTFLTVGFFKYSGLLISFFGTMLISRLLSPEEYGVIASVAVFFGFLAIFLDSGLSAVIIRGEDAPLFQQTVFWISFLMGILLMTVMALMAWPIGRFYHQSNLSGICLLFSILLFLQSISKPFEAILGKRQRYREIALLGLLGNLFQLIVTYVMALLGFSFWALVVPQILIQFLLFYSFYSKVGVSIGAPSWKSIRQVLNNERRVVGNILGFRLLGYSTKNVDTLLVGRLFGTHLLGLYNRGFILSSLPVNMINGVMNDIQMPLYQKLNETDSAAVNREFEALLNLMGAVGFPFLAVLYILPHDLAAFVWGESWRQVGDYLRPLAILIPTNIVLNSVGAMFIVKRAERYLFVNSIVSAAGIVGGALIGSFISMNAMMVGMILGNLLFSVPITCYLGLRKSIGMSWRGIMRAWGMYWIICWLLLIGYMVNSQDFIYWVVALYGGVALVRFYKYYSVHLRGVKME